MTPQERQNLSQRVADRNKGRALAETIIDLVGDDKLTEAAAEAFIEQLQAAFVPSQVHAKVVDDQARFIEASKYELRFGNYHGYTLEQVPMQYLKWLNDNTRLTYDAVHTYLELLPQFDVIRQME